MLTLSGVDKDAGMVNTNSHGASRSRSPVVVLPSRCTAGCSTVPTVMRAPKRSLCARTVPPGAWLSVSKAREHVLTQSVDVQV